MNRDDFWRWMETCPVKELGEKEGWVLTHDDGDEITIRFELFVNSAWYEEDDNGVSPADMYMEDLAYD